ncbi:MAG: DUF1365 domain-containing protein [Jatrophihabitans sp.]
MPLVSQVSGLCALLAPATRDARADTATTLPVRYDVQIGHHREDPISYGFTNHSRTWLVDVDTEDARHSGRLVRFAPCDHFSGDAPTLRAAVQEFLAAAGVHLDGGQILMLANPRVLGYVFNPLSLFWCYRADGTLAAVVAEVHNTYKQRHAYLLHTDERGRASTAKEFYVSPFNPVDGSYTMSVPEPTERIDITITLHRDGQRPFVASMRGRRETEAAMPLGRALSTPLLTRAVMANIKRHGIMLYLKGLRVSPRPPEPTQEGVRQR